jgi:DNA-binding MarR family transcriptional regulator
MADTSLIENKLGLLIWKTSNYWQSNLRKILNTYNISLNEYLILYSINYLLTKKTNIYQNIIADLIGIDISVTSVTLKLLEQKKFITREIKHDNRKKIIKILKEGDNLFKIIYPLIEKQEELIFNKLNNETFNFTNSLKLLLGKKIRIKAEKQNL